MKGAGNSATGKNSLSIGQDNEAIGDYSLAVGRNNITGQRGWYYKALVFHEDTKV